MHTLGSSLAEEPASFIPWRNNSTGALSRFDSGVTTTLSKPDDERGATVTVRKASQAPGRRRLRRSSASALRSMLLTR